MSILLFLLKLFWVRKFHCRFASIMLYVLSMCHPLSIPHWQASTQMAEDVFPQLLLHVRWPLGPVLPRAFPVLAVEVLCAQGLFRSSGKPGPWSPLSCQTRLEGLVSSDSQAPPSERLIQQQWGWKPKTAFVNRLGEIWCGSKDHVVRAQETGQFFPSLFFFF